jgi:hypothetical protein
MRLAEHDGWRCLSDTGRSVRYEKLFDCPELSRVEVSILASNMTAGALLLWLDDCQEIALRFIERAQERE